MNRFEDDHGICNAESESFPIEIEIVRRILKASVMREEKDTEKRTIIYPYEEQGNLLSENEILSRYPCAYAWLTRNKHTLLNRDKSRTQNYKWYEYGRSVGIKSGFGVKILTSSMNLRPNFQMCEDEESLYYSGYGIKPDSGIDLHKLVQILNSESMKQYIDLVSKPFRHSWYSYSKTIIQDFPINSSEVAV